LTARRITLKARIEEVRTGKPAPRWYVKNSAKCKQCGSAFHSHSAHCGFCGSLDHEAVSCIEADQ
jgi:uncharacterized OB-fold protein